MLSDTALFGNMIFGDNVTEFPHTHDGIYNGVGDLKGNLRLTIAYLKEAYTWEPTWNADLMRRDNKYKQDGTPDNPLNMHPDIYVMAKKSVLDQAIWGLLADDPEQFNEQNLPLIYNPALALAGRGVGNDRLLTARGATYDEAIRDFQRLAREMDFSDGLPMIPPTPELVDAMLAGTDRDRNDTFGGLKMRGGIISVETIAINAVMAGAKPEHMPVLVAIGQALAMNWEEDGTAWWTMTTASGGNILVALVSGPIAEEIGMELEMGFAGAGNSVNNALARAFRLYYHNIALNSMPNIDTSGYGSRLSDYMMAVIPENMQALKEIGWESHGEYMGFGKDSNVVALAQTQNGQFGSTNAENWNAINFLTADKTVATISNNFSLRFMSPAHAWALKNGEGASPATASKAAWAAGTPVARVEGLNTGETYRANYGSYPVVVGPDNGAAFNITAGGATTLAGIFNTVLISGSQADPGRASPGAPQNVQVVLDAEKGEATITWTPPAFLGGGTVQRYEVYMYHGGMKTKIDPWTVPGGAAARSYTFENLVPGEQYHFRVRAVSDVVNAIYYINRNANVHWGGTNSRTGQYWIDYNRIRGLGAWGRARNDELSTAAGFSIFSHTIPGRARVPEITAALQNLQRHQHVVRYEVRLPQNIPFEIRQDIDYISLPKIPYRPGVETYGPDAHPFKLAAPAIAAMSPDSASFGWNPVSGAAGYYVYAFDKDPEIHHGAVPLARARATGTAVVPDEFLLENNLSREIPYWFGVQALHTQFATGDSDLALVPGPFVPLTSLKIASANGAPAPALVTVARNRTVQFEIIINDGAIPEGVKWETSNAGLATVDANGLVTIRNMVGTVTLTVSEPNGLSQSIILRIS